MVENDTIIEIKNLTKSFGEVKAVNGISLKVNKGELFAFLGVNGAGKSTTIDIMCGLLARDGGKVVIDGVDIDDDMKSRFFENRRCISEFRLRRRAYR